MVGESSLAGRTGSTDKARTGTRRPHFPLEVAMPLIDLCDWCEADADLECRDCGSRWCAEHSSDHDEEHAQRENACEECGFEFCVCDEIAEERKEEADVDSTRDWTMPERWGI